MSEVVQEKAEQVETVVVQEQTKESAVAAAEATVEEATVEEAALNDDIAMEDIESTPVVEQPPNVHAVLAQLSAIFDPENLKKDNFFRELVERDAEGCECFFF